MFCVPNVFLTSSLVIGLPVDCTDNSPLNVILDLLKNLDACWVNSLFILSGTKYPCSFKLNVDFIILLSPIWISVWLVNWSIFVLNWNFSLSPQ